MECNQTNIGLNVSGDLHARDISVVQNVKNIIKPAESPPKNIRFKVEKPIHTFTGREVFLKELHKVVKEGQDGGVGGVTVLTQDPLSVVAATGGIGKTETVRMYIKLHEHEYDHIIWIDAEDASFARSQFNQLAMRLKISTNFEGKPKEFELILTEIFEKLLLNAHVVLLVFDNAEALEDNHELNLSGIRSLRPTSLSPFFVEPTIIVTSRNQSWGIHNVISLGLWTEEEVVLFVAGRLKLERNSANEALALQLGVIFGRLPIALQSAVAVILQQIKRKKNYRIQSLINEYESGCRKVLAQKPLEANMRPRHMSDTMLVLWNISLEKIAKFENGALAIKIICFMAYMSSRSIPQDFIFALFKNSTTEDCFENAIEILKDYSLIASLSSEDSDSRSLSIHRMIQDSTIENLKTRTNEAHNTNTIFSDNTFLNESKVLIKLAAETVNYLSKFTIYSLPHREELVETLVQITNNVSKNLDVEEFRDLTEGTARVLQKTNNFSQSIEFYKRALEATQSHDEKRIGLYRALADAYWKGGEVQKSLDLYLELLEVQTRALGPHHKDLLPTKGKVACGLHYVGRYDEAMAKYQEVFEGYKNNEDTQSASFIDVKSDFAFLLYDKGEIEKTCEFLAEVLKEQEKYPNSNRNSTITTKMTTAWKLRLEGKYEEAIKLQLQNIEDATKLLGPFDLLTLQCRRGYASALHHEKKFDLAVPLLLDLLETEEAQLGSHHPSTLKTKLILAAVYVGTKELDKAVAMLDVEVMEKVFGPDSLEILKAAIFLSDVKEEQWKLGDALALRDKVLKIRKKVLGPNHEKTLATVLKIGILYVKMDKFEKAAELAQEVLERQEETVGKNHINAIKTRGFLTLCREQLSTRNNLVVNFMAFTSVDADIGKLFLEASNWNLEVALESFYDANPNEDNANLDLQAQALIPSAAATDTENKNVTTATASCNETEVNTLRDRAELGVQVKSVTKPIRTTTSIIFRFPGGARLQGEFGVSSTVRDLYEFVNERRPDLAVSNYVLTMYPNTKLTEMEETLEEANLLNNVALTIKML